MPTLLDEARDPATPQDRLDHLATWSNHVEIMRAVAGNPNAAAWTLSELAGKGFGQWILENPVLPLLFLEGDWSQWTFEGVRDLRIKAFDLLHDLFPSLVHVPCPNEWHYVDNWRHMQVAKCDTHMCAKCWPEEAAEFLRMWKRRREQQDGNQ